MHGLINRSLQNFLTDTFGEAGWQSIAVRAGVAPEGFEAMLAYEDAVTDRLLDAACEVLKRSECDLLEDLGTWLSMREPVRRLLRYGGRDYYDFMISLNELQGRAQMTLADLHLPELILERTAEAGRFVLKVRGARRGWGALMAGLLRAMADDYGALALIELLEAPAEPDGVVTVERIEVQLLDNAHARGRSFELGMPLGGAL